MFAGCLFLVADNPHYSGMRFIIFLSSVVSAAQYNIDKLLGFLKK